MSAAQLLFGLCLVALLGGLAITLVMNIWHILRNEGDESCSAGE